MLHPVPLLTADERVVSFAYLITRTAEGNEVDLLICSVLPAGECLIADVESDKLDRYLANQRQNRQGAILPMYAYHTPAGVFGDLFGYKLPVTIPFRYAIPLFHRLPLDPAAAGPFLRHWGLIGPRLSTDLFFDWIAALDGALEVQSDITISGVSRRDFDDQDEYEYGGFNPD